MTAGVGAAGDGYTFSSASPGEDAGSYVFALGGTNVITVSSGTNTLPGSLADWSGAPTEFVKNGNGTLVLSATNTFTGSMVVNGGELIVSGNISSSTNTYVNSGSTLTGSGMMGGVTVNAGGTLAPGLGSLTMNNLTWSGAGNYNWQFYNATGNAGADYGTIHVNGTLNVSNASSFAINLWSLSSTNPLQNGNPINFNSLTDSWTLVQTTGGITGFNPNHFVIQTKPNNGAGGFTSTLGVTNFSLGVIGNNLVLAPVVAPGRPSSRRPMRVRILPQ